MSDGGKRQPVLIIGAGNLLMGDEGVGVHVLRHLEQTVSDPGIRLLDGGTGGINLLGELESSDHVIFIDATRDGQLLGHLPRLRVVTISVTEIHPMSLELSPEVEASVPLASSLALDLALADLNEATEKT